MIDLKSPAVWEPTLVAGLLFFPGLGVRDFWDLGEPIYGEVGLRLSEYYGRV